MVALASLSLLTSYTRQQSISTLEKIDEQAKKINEYENKLQEMKESLDKHVAIQNIQNYKELEHLWTAMNSPSFCESMTEQKSTGYMKDININGLEPFKIEIYRANDIVSNQIKMSGAWDLSKLRLFQKIVGDYSREKGIPLNELTFVDIGGNIGWFSLSMAAMGLEVMSFEPMASNIDMMRRSLCNKTNIKSGISRRVELFPFGLGPKEESCIVYSGNINEGDGVTMCGKTEEEITIPDGYAIRGKIITKRLDDVASSEGKNIALVKMDVEGYESHVVEGGRSFLLDSKIPFIVAEFVPQWMKDLGGDPERMINRFYDAGYKVLANGHHLPRDQATDMKRYGINGAIDDVVFELVE